AVIAAGYIFILRPAASGNPSIPLAAPSPLSAGGAPESTKAKVARALQLVGEALPTSEAEVKSVSLDLAAAGYRWPSAVGVLYGIKVAATLLLGFAFGLVAFLATNGTLFSASLAGMCAAAFGYKLIGRVMIDLIRARNNRL